jgi:Uri superfamily endonuclease
MLYVYVDSVPKDCIVRVTPYFNLHKEKEWFSDPFVRKVIQEIDRCEVVKDEYIESPIWGGVSPERLSGGCKALIVRRVRL